MIEIHHSKSKRKPFRVRYDAENNENIATSQNLGSKEAAKVNILAMAKGFGTPIGETIRVKDFTLPKPRVILLKVKP